MRRPCLLGSRASDSEGEKLTQRPQSTQDVVSALAGFDANLLFFVKDSTAKLGSAGKTSLRSLRTLREKNPAAAQAIPPAGRRSRNCNCSTGTKRPLTLQKAAPRGLRAPDARLRRRARHAPASLSPNDKGARAGIPGQGGFAATPHAGASPFGSATRAAMISPQPLRGSSRRPSRRAEPTDRHAPRGLHRRMERRRSAGFDGDPALPRRPIRCFRPARRLPAE
jgi:hypothetical protein